MREHLLFTLYAPMGAWGSPSLSASNAAFKTTEIDPTRSALVGLLGAAMGWGRHQLGVLDTDLAFAVRVDLAPSRDPKPDYHTITPADPPAGRERWTRFEELRCHLVGSEAKGAILSRREYWTNGLWTVAVHSSGSPTVHELAAALADPIWPLSAGRKAFALGLPLEPMVIQAENLATAFHGYGLPWTRREGLLTVLSPLIQAVPPNGGTRLMLDTDYPDAPPLLRLTERRDRPDPGFSQDNRLTRRFRVRSVAEALLPGDSA
ncbi:MAG: type I-E CRISPR-associated protein Cas5/CasD [Geminicoccaceae bacterium]